MNGNILTIALTMGCLLVPLAAKTKIVAEFTSVECENQSPEILKIFKCRLEHNLKNRTAIFLDALMTEDLSNMTGTFTLRTEYLNTLVNYTTQPMDYCEALHVVHTHYIIKMLTAEVRRVANFPLDCPFKKNVLYQVKGLVIDTKVIPVYLPPLPFQAEMTFIYKQRKVARLQVAGHTGRK